MSFSISFFCTAGYNVDSISSIKSKPPLYSDGNNSFNFLKDSTAVKMVPILS